jgi:outer membrane protein
MKKILFILLFLFISGSLKAQPGSKVQVFSLEDCISAAENNNTEIQIANAQMNASRSDMTAAFGEFLPSIDFTAGYNKNLKTTYIWVGGTYLPFIPNPNSYNMSVNANYVIFDGFSRGANYKRSQLYFNSYYENTLYTKSRIKLNIHKQYIDVIRNAQVVNIRKSNLELGKKELERINALYKAGTKPVSVIYAQEAELGNRELELVQANNNLDQAKAQLLVTMGLNPDMPAEFTDRSIPDTLYDNDMEKFRAEIGNSSSAVSQAMNNRSDFAAAKYNIESANASLRIAESGYYPTLTVGGGWSWSNSEFVNFGDNSSTRLGLNLSVPIFDNFRTNRQIESARLQVSQRQIEELQTEQSIRSDVQMAYLNLQSAEKQAEIAERALKSAAKSFESFTEMYRLGTVGYNDYLTANNQYITAQINRINAVYSYFLAKKQVLYAMGKL